jgi:hypothetical protein
MMLVADVEGVVPDDVMEPLLSHGAKIDEQDPQGNTPLMIATKAGGFFRSRVSSAKKSRGKCKEQCW